MLEIISWLLALGVAGIGVISLQLGLSAPKESRDGAALWGYVAFICCGGGAALLAYLASQQASSIGTLGGY